MKLDFLVMVVVFWALALGTWRSPTSRRAMFSRGTAEWLLDLVGLTIHGIVVPVVQTLLLFKLLHRWWPAGRGALAIPAIWAFLGNFVLVDYLYYWNHRLLHSRWLWRFHSLHHSGTSFDVFTTSRNSAVTTFLILYVWVNAFALYVLADPVPYAFAILASNCLDLLRHGRVVLPWSWWPAKLFISPQEHGWHHSQDLHGVNFGGNFNLWDRLHGTYRASPELPERFGVSLRSQSLWHAFWKGSL